MNEPQINSRPRCDGCHYWMKIEGDRKGRCHRHPPKPYNIMHSAWPETDASMWCGEFKARDVSKPVPVTPSKGKRASYG